MSSVIRKTITITDKQAQWVKSQIADEGYTNDSEYFRALLRKEQRRKESFNALQAAIDEGLNSGISPRSMEEIWADGEAHYADG